MEMASSASPSEGLSEPTLRVPFDDDDDGGLVVNRFLAQQRELHKSLSEISSTEVLREAEELRVEENDEDDIDKLIEELGVSDGTKKPFGVSKGTEVGTHLTGKNQDPRLQAVREEPKTKSTIRNQSTGHGNLARRSSAIGKYAGSKATLQTLEATFHDARDDEEAGPDIPRPKSSKSKKRRQKAKDPVSLWRGAGAPESDEHIGEGTSYSAQLLQYAEYIGIDAEIEPELMWIAEEGLVAPLPEGWSEYSDSSGHQYYYNFNTGVSTWEHPSDAIYRAMVEEHRQAGHGGRPVGA